MIPDKHPLECPEELRAWQLRDREADARNWLIERYTDFPRVVAAHTVRHPTPMSVEYADLVSAATVPLLTRIDAYDWNGGACFKAYAWKWLKGAVLDEFYWQLYRSPQATRAGMSSLSAHESAGEELADERSQQIDLSQAQDANLLLRHLNPRERRALDLIFYDGLSRAEAAQQMGIGVSTMNQLMGRTLGRLRQYARTGNAPSEAIDRKHQHHSRRPATSDPTELSAIAKRIQELRSERKLTLYRLGMLARTDVGLIRRIESGKRCTLGTLEKIADALAVPLTALISVTDPGIKGSVSAARAGAAISRKRVELGLTQTSLGEKAGLVGTMISRIECGKAQTFEQIRKCCAPLGLDPHSVLS